MNINKYLQPGESVNVIASAGTGKTWFIISKILRLLLDDVAPEKITAITFTRKTTAEMQTRLNDKIEYWASSTEQEILSDLHQIGISNNLTHYINKARKLFLKIQLSTKNVRISTFDSLFMEILNQMHLDKEILKNINTNSYPKLIAKDILDNIFNKNYLENNLDIKNNLDFLLDHIGSFHTLKESILEVTDKKSYFLEIYQDIEYKNGDYKNRDIRVALCKERFIEKIIKNFNTNNILKERHKEFYNSILKKNISTNYKVNLISEFFLTKSTRSPRKILKKEFEKLNINFDIFLNDIYSFEENIFYEIQKSWKFLASIFFTIYQKHLIENNLRDYSDSTWLCYNKLVNAKSDSWIYYKIASSINHLLIDEFQDTNYLQWRIIEKILGAINDPSCDTSVTIVGDNKQSIYGFRGSEPKLFKKCRNYTKKYFNASELSLNQSRRSSKEIIKFVNSIFPDSNNFHTNIIKKGIVKIEEICETEDTNIIDEANSIAKQINKLVKNDNIKYHDIIILLRNRTHLIELEEVLIKNSIPISSDKKKSILDNPEILDLFYLLKYLILNERNNYELFELLKCPIFNYSLDEINKIDIDNFNALSKFLENGKYKSLLAKWRELNGKIPIHDFLNTIYLDLDIFNIYFVDNHIKNIEIKRNFLIFLNMSLSLNNGRFISPFQFLYQLEITKEYPESFDFLTKNSVKILTIHSAKGLESEVIFLAQTYLKNNNKNSSKILPVFNNDLSCKDLYLHLPGIFKNNKNIEKLFIPLREKDITEEQNLLYVACTRAKSVLIANGFRNAKCDGSWFSNFLSS